MTSKKVIKWNQIFSPLNIFLLVILLFIGYKFIPDDGFKITDKQTYPHIKISFGEEILIQKKPWLSGDDKWKNICWENWNLKEQGTSEDNDALRDFVTQCSQDAEAGIYFNNQKAKDSDKSTVKIAVSVPISRTNGVFDAVELLKGVELAQRKINRNGGINIGRKKALLEVGIIDEGWNSQVDDVIEDWENRNETEKEKVKSQLVASQLVDSDVVGVVGHFSSDALEAAAPIYQKHQLVAISPTSTARRKSNKRNKVLAYIPRWQQAEKSLALNNYIFRTAPNDIIAINKLITDYVKPQKINKVIVVYDASSKFSRLYKQEFHRQFEDQKNQDIEVMNLVSNQDNCAFEFDKNDEIDINQVTDCVSKITTAKPDALLIVFSTANALQLKSTQLISGGDQKVNFFKLIEEKINPIPQFLGADSVYKEGFLSQTEVGMIVSVPMARERRYFSSEVTQENESIIVNWRTSMAYDATKAIAKSIENTNNKTCANLPSNKNQCRQQIQKKLTFRNFIADGMMYRGSIKFDKNGDREVEKNSHLAPLLEVKKDEPDSFLFAPYSHTKLD